MKLIYGESSTKNIEKDQQTSYSRNGSRRFYGKISWTHQYISFKSSRSPNKSSEICSVFNVIIYAKPNVYKYHQGFLKGQPYLKFSSKCLLICFKVDDSSFWQILQYEEILLYSSLDECFHHWKNIRFFCHWSMNSSRIITSRTLISVYRQTLSHEGSMTSWVPLYHLSLSTKHRSQIKPINLLNTYE